MVKILLVDDEDQFRTSLAKRLRKRGYDVHEAEDAEEALRISEDIEGPVQLLLTDIVMPGMNGKELYERLAESRS